MCHRALPDIFNELLTFLANSFLANHIIATKKILGYKSSTTHPHGSLGSHLALVLYTVREQDLNFMTFTCTLKSPATPGIVAIQEFLSFCFSHSPLVMLQGYQWADKSKPETKLAQVTLSAYTLTLIEPF